MSPDQADDQPDVTPLAPKSLTDRLSSLEPGDEVTINNHAQKYEVINTNAYSVIVEDPNGHHITLSQNLQSGGWMLTEDVFYADACDN